jgi:hypothetical protein
VIRWETWEVHFVERGDTVPVTVQGHLRADTFARETPKGKIMAEPKQFAVVTGASSGIGLELARQFAGTTSSSSSPPRTTS